MTAFQLQLDTALPSWRQHYDSGCAKPRLRRRGEAHGAMYLEAIIKAYLATVL
jgi:hypothetical protein